VRFYLIWLLVIDGLRPKPNMTPLTKNRQKNKFLQATVLMKARCFRTHLRRKEKKTIMQCSISDRSVQPIVNVMSYL